MTIALSVSFLAFAVALVAVWAASEVSKKTLGRATSMVKDHATEMLKIAGANDHAIAQLKDDLLALQMENKELKKEIAEEAERRSRDVEQINEHFQDLESGWGPNKPKPTPKSVV